MDIRQYGSAMTVSEKAFSEMLDAFYAERDQIERMRVKSQIFVCLRITPTV